MFPVTETITMMNIFIRVSPLHVRIDGGRQPKVFAKEWQLSARGNKWRRNLNSRIDCTSWLARVRKMSEKTPMAHRKFVCTSLLARVRKMSEKTPTAHSQFVCAYLVIMTLGDLDKQGDYDATRSK